MTANNVETIDNSLLATAKKICISSKKLAVNAICVHVHISPDVFQSVNILCNLDITPQRT